MARTFLRSCLSFHAAAQMLVHHTLIFANQTSCASLHAARICTSAFCSGFAFVAKKKMAKNMAFVAAARCGHIQENGNVALGGGSNRRLKGE